MIPVKDIILSTNKLTLVKDERMNLPKFTIYPLNATNKEVDWILSNDNVSLTNGILTGHKIGTCELTVITVDGEYQDSCTITIAEHKLYDALGRIIIENQDIMEMSSTKVIIDKETGYKSNVTPLVMPRRGATYIEGFVNFFNEVLHDILFLMKRINSNPSNHNGYISLKEYCYNNSIRLLTGSTRKSNGELRQVLMGLPDKVQMYKEDKFINNYNIKGTKELEERIDAYLPDLERS